MFNKLIRYFQKKENNNGTFLFTIGYEGLKSEEFISCLKENNIKNLVDIREVPWSRKKGFSKPQLENYLAKNGIKYTHMKKLGSPSVLRKKVKTDGDYSYFFKKYTNYIETQSDELESLKKIAEETICCLMCFERDFNFCHRKIVASEVEKKNSNGLKVVHL